MTTKKKFVVALSGQEKGHICPDAIQIIRASRAGDVVGFAQDERVERLKDEGNWLWEGKFEFDTLREAVAFAAYRGTDPCQYGRATQIHTHFACEGFTPMQERVILDTLHSWHDGDTIHEGTPLPDRLTPDVDLEEAIAKLRDRKLVFEEESDS